MEKRRLPIGERIAALRQSKGMTQSELASLMHVSFQSVSKWEKNISYPDISLIPELARLFDVTTDYLLGTDLKGQDTQYFLAADQGGTKTRVHLCRFDGSIVSEVETAGGCWFYVGIETSMKYLKEAVDTIKAKCHVSSKEISFMVCGAAGINWEDERGMFTQALESAIQVRSNVYNDCGAAIYCDALEMPNRVLLCAGTEFGASVVTADMPDPYVYCNEIQLDPEVLGGNAIGRAAVKAVLQAEEHLAEATMLREPVMKFFGVEKPFDLLSGFLRGKLKQPIQKLSPIVFEMAGKGDAASMKILLNLADHMSQYAIAAIEKHSLSKENVGILLAGGIFRGELPAFYERIESNIKRVCPGAVMIRTKVEPIEGAYHLGMIKAKEMQQ